MSLFHTQIVFGLIEHYVLGEIIYACHIFTANTKLRTL